VPGPVLNISAYRYVGACFVFDRRERLGPDLAPMKGAA
jgi:hypothetical protein